MNKPVMYEWPESQICMDCQHSEFIMSDKLNNSNYLCMEGCDNNDGVVCPEFEQKSGVKEVEVLRPRVNNSDIFECSLLVILNNGRICEIDVESMTKTETWSQGDE